MSTKFNIETTEIPVAINVVCIRAKSFPEGLMAAHESLHKLAPFDQERAYYGISWGGKDGITYLAAASELQPGELDEHELERFTIAPGPYLSVKVSDYDQIKDAFSAMLQDPRIKNGAQCLFRSGVQTMKLSYFEDTDTLYIELKHTDIAESKDMDENTIMDLDSEGDIVAITMEHASKRTDLQNLTLSGIAA